MVKRTYQGIVFMILAALGFSLMGACARMLKGSFSAGQLVLWRNLIGLMIMLPGLILKPPVNKLGGKPGWLMFRGFMGAISLYTYLYCILTMPLGTANAYIQTSTIWIALFSMMVFKEMITRPVFWAIVLGFAGMLLVYRPSLEVGWDNHLVGILSGFLSAIAYLTVGRLNKYYDARVIVMAFLVGGILLPLLSMSVRLVMGLPADDLFLFEWEWPAGMQWFWILGMGLWALFGQYYVTRAYGADQASIVSAISYANIFFGVLLGIALGDGVPDLFTTMGIVLIVLGGVIISYSKKSDGKHQEEAQA